MKLWNWWKNGLAICLAALFFAGCQSTQYAFDPSDAAEREAEQLRVGDTVRVIYSNLSTPIPPHEEQIKQDGTITVPQIGRVQAAGKASGELQSELQNAYSKYYREITLTVQTPDRSYYVGGEVKAPQRLAYVSATTVIKAIQSAGDFTDFAKRTKVQLTRANGKRYTVNCEKALRDPRLDLPVYPGDSINVPKRIF